MKFSKYIVYLFLFLNVVPAFSQDISVHTQILIEKKLNDFIEHMEKYAQGKHPSRVILEDYLNALDGDQSKEQA